MKFMLVMLRKILRKSFRTDNCNQNIAVDSTLHTNKTVKDEQRKMFGNKLNYKTLSLQCITIFVAKFVP